MSKKRTRKYKNVELVVPLPTFNEIWKIADQADVTVGQAASVMLALALRKEGTRKRSRR